jgi:hypothetical protein
MNSLIVGYWILSGILLLFLLGSLVLICDMFFNQETFVSDDHEFFDDDDDDFVDD